MFVAFLLYAIVIAVFLGLAFGLGRIFYGIGDYMLAGASVHRRRGAYRDANCPHCVAARRAALAKEHERGDHDAAQVKGST